MKNRILTAPAAVDNAIFTTAKVNFARRTMARDKREVGVEGVTILVNDAGDWLVPGTPEFNSAIGDADPDFDSVSFAVKNLGFIKFQIFGQSIAEIELHPRNVEMTALLAAQQQLLSLQVRLFRLKFLENEWRSEITSSAEHVIARLSELCAPQPCPLAADRFVVEPQDFSRVFLEEDNWLRPAAVKWRMSFGQFDSSVISLAVTHHILPRLVIVGVKPNGADPTFRFIGAGHENWLESKYHTTVIGEKINALPDKDYGMWAAEFYKNVARSGQPRYDYVSATIDRPPHKHVTRYERLLLPWKTPSEEILVTLWSRGLPDAPTHEPACAEEESWSVKKPEMSS